MISEHAASIAHTLDANEADIELVRDMADTLEESHHLGLYKNDRAEFVSRATAFLRERIAHIDSQISRELRA